MRQQGIQVVEASSAILQFVTLTSPDGSLDEVGLGDVATRYVLPELRRLPGVGRARLFSTERAMRIWLDPDKMLGLSLTAGDVEAAIRAQNAQVSSGLLGTAPSPVTERTQNRFWSRASSKHRRSSAPSCCAPIRTARRCASPTWRASRSEDCPTPSRRG